MRNFFHMSKKKKSKKHTNNYVEMGIECTNTQVDINEAFYSSVAAMYEAVVSAINKQEDSEIYNNFKDRLKAVVEDTDGIGWGFHDDLSDIHFQIKWLDLEDIEFDEEEVKIKQNKLLSRTYRNNIMAKILLWDGK